MTNLVFKFARYFSAFVNSGAFSLAQPEVPSSTGNRSLGG